MMDKAQVAKLLRAATKGPWEMIIDDTGGQQTGWPSISAPEEIDATIIHTDGFHQEFWGDLSKRECLANARLIAAAPDIAAAYIEAREVLATARGLLWCAWREMNAIRAESGVPYDQYGGRKGIVEEYWSDVVDAMQKCLGDDAKPWPSDDATAELRRIQSIASRGAE